MFIRGLASLLLGVVFSGCGGTSTEAEDAGDGSWGQTYTKEETDWERDWSAGEVGCSPDEIQVSDLCPHGLTSSPLSTSVRWHN